MKFYLAETAANLYLKHMFNNSAIKDGCKCEIYFIKFI